MPLPQGVDRNALPDAMAKEIPSVGDLHQNSEVTDDEIEAATST